MTTDTRAVRRAALQSTVDIVERRIAAACAASGRPRADVTLIAVTKTYPASDVEILAELGVREIGENRDQEARTKFDALSGQSLRWHFVGQIQRNKAKSVARYADVVHTVDRVELAEALARGVVSADRPRLDVLLQVNLDPAATGVIGPRGGVAPDHIADLAIAVDSYPELRLRGVMAVAPLGGDPNEAFGRLAVISRELRRHSSDATLISAGMSSDLELAIAHGATHVRVGRDLLGAR